MDLLENTELGLSLHYWEGKKKEERVFLAAEIMRQLGYSPNTNTLQNSDLIEGADYVKVFKKANPSIFEELQVLKTGSSNKPLIGRTASKLLFLYESGIWKLVQQSKKPIGVKTRHWLATEVLPSIMRTGKYEAPQGATMLSAFFDHTERKVQLDHSKQANAAIFKTDEKDFIGYHNTLHSLIAGMTAQEIKEYYGSTKSAREIIRAEKPALACVYSFFDEALEIGVPLDELVKENLHNTLKPVFESLLSIGWDKKVLGRDLSKNP